jgi:restriction system protein
MPLSMVDAAYSILKELGTPAHYTEIIEQAISRNLIRTSGLTPGASLIAVISRENAARTNRGESPRFDVLGSGMYGLVEWRPVGIERRIQEINRATREELRRRVTTMSPGAFEELVGELLIAIGFDEDTVKVTGRSGDGGIDVVGVMEIEGVTRLDAAVQVKRVKANIPPDKITSLRGSLMPNQRGIFITTSRFTKQAIYEATAGGKSPISVVDGNQLLDLLFKHKIGVLSQQHTIYEIDTAYWPEAPSSTAPAVSTDRHGRQERIPINYPLRIYARYHNQIIEAELLESGQVIVNGQTYNSVSAAGLAVTGWKSCNGWRFWLFIDSAENVERSIDVLRNTSTDNDEHDG